MSVLNLNPVSSSSSSQEQPASVQLFIYLLQYPTRGLCQQGFPALGLLQRAVSAEPRGEGSSRTRLLWQQLSAVSVKREKYGSPGHHVTQNSNLTSLKPVFLFGIKEAMVWAGGDLYFCSTDTHPIFSYWRGKRNGKGLKESNAEQLLQRQGKGRAGADGYPRIWTGKQYKSQHIPFPCIGPSLALRFH